MAAWLGLLQGGKHLLEMHTNREYSGAFVGENNKIAKFYNKKADGLRYDLGHALSVSKGQVDTMFQIPASEMSKADYRTFEDH